MTRSPIDESNWQRRHEMGIAHALSQSEHEVINARHPGLTRQHCTDCGEETGRCEDDSLFDERTETGPLCEGCWREREAQATIVADGAGDYTETKPDPRFNPGELAAWTLIGNILLNLDEAITKG